MEDTPFISVIIPVLNDSERLEICLNALEQQTYPKDLYEVIVVDNGSTENLEVLVNKFTQASFTCETQVGSYAARNKGISIARGEVLAFTDSDCIPAPNWLETGGKHLLSVPNCGLVAGKIEMFFKDSNPTSVELYDSSTFLQQKKYVEEDKYGTTANLFTFKKVFEDIGYFNDELKSGGDLVWGQRVFSLGYSIIYADDSCVAHPARHSWSQLYEKVVRVSEGHYEMDREHEKNKSSLVQLITYLSGLKPPLRNTFRKVSSNKLLKSNKQKPGLFLVTLFVHYVYVWRKIRLQMWEIVGFKK